jgi:hypothetical protein
VAARTYSQRVPEIYEDPGSGLNWSHDALRRASFYYPASEEPPDQGDVLYRHLVLARDAERARSRGELVTGDRLAESAELLAQRLDDQTRPANILIEETDGGFAQLPPLTLPAIAAWLYRTPAALNEEVVTQLLRPEALEDCHEVLERIINLDHAPQAIPSNSAANDNTLQASLDAGLERHQGKRLAGAQPTLYLHLLCRGYDPARLRVCERCQLVHPAARARTCKQCRKSPRRLEPKPWHVGVAVGARASSQAAATFLRNASVTVSHTLDRRPTQTIYIGRCVCGNQFQSTRANTRYCKECGSPRGRTARARANRTPPLTRGSSHMTVMPEQHPEGSPTRAPRR